MTRSTTARFAATAATLALAGLLAACGASGGSEASDGDATTTEAESTTTAADGATTTEGGSATTTAPGDGGETTTTLSSEGRDTETSELDTLPDGDHYGYMAGLEEGTVEGQDVQVIIFDKVDFLTGQEAIDAAAEDGVQLDTDYYVRNENQTVRRLAVVPEASVTTLEEGTSGTVPSSVSEVWNQPHLFKINVGNVRGITTVSGIEAVYLP
jgi:hypothetical protein